MNIPCQTWSCERVADVDIVMSDAGTRLCAWDRKMISDPERDGTLL